ncbi:MAG: S1C family serine protease [Patescibacteria group bacterium]|jgi:serine protease Do
MFNKIVKKLFPGERPTWQLWALIVVLVSVFGLLAGLGGQMLGNQILWRYSAGNQQLVELNNSFYELLSKYNFLGTADQPGAWELVIRRPESAAGLTAVNQVEAGALQSSLKQGTVTFFNKAKVASRDPLAAVYRPSEALGRGFILTTDGWLVTTSQVLSGSLQSQVAVGADGVAYKLEKIIRDPLTSAVLVKIAANNLPLLNLGEEKLSPIGGALVALTADGGVKVATIENNDYRPANKSLSDLAVSSESLSEYYLAGSAWDNVLPGEPTVDQNGRVNGLTATVAGRQMILPLFNFQKQISQALKQGKFVRAKLGVDYLNLAQINLDSLAVKALAGRRAGALIYSNSAYGRAGVKPGSPAAAAGLLVGDIILQVEGEKVGQPKDLSQLIQSYNADQEIELTIVRSGEEKKVKVKLGEL